MPTVVKAGRRSEHCHSNGSLIKFLDQDDRLEPDCVSRMVASLSRSRFRPGWCLAVGASKSRPILRLPGTGVGYGELHPGFDVAGRPQFRDEASARNRKRQFKNRWASPSCVMVRRGCLEVGRVPPQSPPIGGPGTLAADNDQLRRGLHRRGTSRLQALPDLPHLGHVCRGETVAGPDFGLWRR